MYAIEYSIAKERLGDNEEFKSLVIARREGKNFLLLPEEMEELLDKDLQQQLLVIKENTYRY